MGYITLGYAVMIWFSAMIFAATGIDSDTAVKHIYVNSGPGEPFEVCEGETFKPECSPDEVVIMSKATYGRMHVGRCLDPRETINMGCSNDLLPQLDKICSGEQTCKVKVDVRRSEFSGLTNCPFELRKYLEVEYVCEKVWVPSQKCVLPISLLVESTISVVSNNLLPSGCRSLNFHASPGQNLDIALIDFSFNQQSNSNGRQCPNKYAEIMELDRDGRIQVCSGMKRQDMTYSTKTNDIRIILAQEAIEATHKFLLHISVLLFLQPWDVKT